MGYGLSVNTPFIAIKHGILMLITTHHNTPSDIYTPLNIYYSL